MSSANFKPKTTAAASAKKFQTYSSSSSFNGVLIIIAGRKLRNSCFCACAVNVAKNKSTKNVAKSASPTFRNFYRKSMSLRTTVTTEFEPGVQVTAFMRMRKKKWWKTVLNAIWSSKFSTLISSRGCWIKWRCQNCSLTLENCLVCTCTVTYDEKSKKL